MDSDFSLLEGLRKINFVSQEKLNKTLKDLMIQERNSKVVFRYFQAQLERKKDQKLPHWKISCQTSSQITAVVLARTLSYSLFQNFADPKVKVQGREELESLDSTLEVFLPNSLWSPCYLNPELFHVFNLMETEVINEKIVLPSIQERPQLQKILSRILKQITKKVKGN